MRIKIAKTEKEPEVKRSTETGENLCGWYKVNGDENVYIHILFLSCLSEYYSVIFSNIPRPFSNFREISKKSVEENVKSGIWLPSTEEEFDKAYSIENKKHEDEFKAFFDSINPGDIFYKFDGTTLWLEKIEYVYEIESDVFSFDRFRAVLREKNMKKVIFAENLKTAVRTI